MTIVNWRWTWRLTGYENIVRVLIEHGAKVNAEDDAKSTPLHEAAANGKVFSLHSIFSRFIWYFFLTFSGHENVVRALIENGAKVDAENNGGRTPLQRAIYTSKSFLHISIENFQFKLSCGNINE